MVDSYNHHSKVEILKNQTYENITIVRIENDSYKHRVMILGVS